MIEKKRVSRDDKKREKFQRFITTFFRIWCFWIIIVFLYEAMKIRDNDARIISIIIMLSILAVLEWIIVYKFKNSKNIFILLIIIFIGIVYINLEKFIKPLNLVKTTENELYSIN